MSGAGPDVLAAVARHRLVPVITLDEPRHARPLLDALTAGGLPCAEVTFRTAAAAEGLREMAAAAGGQALIGAGSVLRAEQVDQAVRAGARFIVTPGLSPAVLRACAEHAVPVIPGVATATEICAALDSGISTVKLFPAEPLGGLNLINALRGPFPDVRFVPTGGIGAGLLPDYLACPAVAAVGGSWMASRGLIQQERFAEITALTADAVAVARG
ncbi:MAG TPA: bifunctional 4-hydroxy-2-oxoglutarate aldolase/2-dehydro-3-deoxy-phosphogluconate aldolase [Streptosporangiaceae bacterium]|jgi:2-dehydro-3-deoxyphosphogluconate aldolase/(4S)-4-hydroxy-2-oxoglutarate aldolase|nr:bifunctional 4-hydroxy-2-oxoglutarate aldolase/2-dehydro-3-deoxy-phosphogluconate aldolase [Streptosporangiaceae bacterium]